ncbi:phage tail sheath C-terminal domain-containing protein [Paracoccus ravus]|uniref:phage tail sheath C-terminal domain-containing protein n=1 Tax=Paracoccus ravus TaxID=2447760 RepID=UPI001431F695|nr:phage tail sheath C-terminal domain-containing protein [Paracoccus ravus]
MTVLVVPGVSIATRFDVLPPLPAASGVVGIAAIIDRPPATASLIGLTKSAEIDALLGPGTRASAPEIVHALGNGAQEVVVSPVLGGGAASLVLNNADGAPAVILRARSNGSWAHRLSVDIRALASGSGGTARVTLRLLAAGQVIEEFPDLAGDRNDPSAIFDVINTRSVHVVAVDPGFDGDDPTPGTYALPGDGSGVPVNVTGEATELFRILAETGVDETGLSVEIAGSGNAITVRVSRTGAVQEEFTRLTMDPDSARHLPAVLLANSALVTLRQANSLAPAARLPAATTAPIPLQDGSSPNAAAYQAAIDRLGDDPRINLVLAAIEPTATSNTVRTIHQALVAHAVQEAENGSPRIALGAVTAGEQPDLDQVRDHAAAVRNRRFVLVSPAGAAGAVAGLVSRLSPEISPTFKTVPLFGLTPASYSGSELNKLLGPSHNALVVQQRSGRGIIVLRGLDTSGDQISVTRVADAAIRETKAIAENFIGQLNSSDARAALRSQIIATFTRMERAGALVPSTDGTDPAFFVDVYSTQLDFAQGIVRIDIAVRPVRAIDFIYATIRVKN